MNVVGQSLRITPLNPIWEIISVFNSLWAILLAMVITWVILCEVDLTWIKFSPAKCLPTPRSTWTSSEILLEEGGTNNVAMVNIPPLLQPVSISRFHSFKSSVLSPAEIDSGIHWEYPTLGMFFKGSVSQLTNLLSSTKIKDLSVDARAHRRQPLSVTVLPYPWKNKPW